MRVNERKNGDQPRVYLGQPRQSFSPAERYIGGSWVQPGWQKLGGIREIGLWCGRGRGKRRNQITEDSTGQGKQLGKEEQLGFMVRIGDQMQLGFSGTIWRTISNVLFMLMAGLPTFMEVVFPHQNGMVQLWTGQQLNKGGKQHFMSQIFQITYLCFDWDKLSRSVVFRRMFT